MFAFFFTNKISFLLLLPLFKGCQNDKAYITLLVTDIHKILSIFNITVNFSNLNLNHKDDSSKSGWTP